MSCPEPPPPKKKKRGGGSNTFLPKRKSRLHDCRNMLNCFQTKENSLIGIKLISLLNECKKEDFSAI